MAGARKKVLWVDDEIEYLRSHIMFLETRGYSVIPVFSGDDAIQVLQESPREFDIVLLDEQMPGKDGLTTLVEIKEMLPDLPVVMVTKSEEEQVMEDALGRKIDGYLTKPVNPSQILMVCKSLLDSRTIISTEISRRFVRHYSESRAALSRSMSTGDWIRLYNNLTWWDFELEKIDDEGLRQTHAGQKSDSNAAFAQFIIDTYGSWMKGECKPPVMSPDVVARHVYPLLAGGRRVVFVVLDNMRLDQYFAIESLLKSYYSIERHCYYSILPTSTRFARTALLAGRSPLEISETYPELFKEPEEDQHDITGLDMRMFLENLKRLGADVRDSCRFAAIRDGASAQVFLDGMKTLEETRVMCLMVNFVDMLTQGRTLSTLLQELAPDESAFRSLTKAWFRHSTLFQILREFSHHDVTVVLASDHGSILCSRGTEMYGCDALSPNLRYMTGEQITCDERHAHFVSAPEQFKLPAFTKDMRYILARENYYFILPDSFKNYQNQYKNSFYCGGISMEEMIVPVAIMNPRQEG